ncbi:MAG TPA: hypothetical protein ENI23_06720 [bacterium]|nr:hypothetical protein [bacterium]
MCDLQGRYSLKLEKKIRKTASTNCEFKGFPPEYGVSWPSLSNKCKPSQNRDIGKIEKRIDLDLDYPVSDPDFT